MRLVFFPSLSKQPTHPHTHSWFLDEGIVTLMLTIFEQYEHNNLVHSLVIGTLRSLVSANDPLVV